MKILHVLDHSIPLHSGYTFRTRAILEQQHRLGWETAHVTSSKHQGALADEEDVDGLHFYRTRPSSALLSRLPILNQLDVVSSLAKRLDEVIEREKPEILHAHSPSLNGLAAIRAGRKHGLPVVYECRAFWEDAAVDHGTSKEGGLRYRLTRAMETRVFREADAVTTICEGLKRDIVDRGIPQEKVTVIPNAVDLERFTNQGVVNQELVEKLLIRALPAILDAIPRVRVLLVGGGPQEQELKSLVKELDLEQWVIFTGRVPHEEVAGYYQLVDILVYPRLNMRLTDLVTPLKPLEAMAQGKLVLASDVGGHRELISNGRNGILFDAGDEQSLARSVIDLVHNDDSWELIRRRGRLYVEEERNWPTSVANYKRVYARVYARKLASPVSTLGG